MLFTALTFLGIFSYKQLKVELLPNAELPVFYVQVISKNDMDPSYIESEAVIPVESAISSISGVDKIETEIQSRYASIKVTFKSDVKLNTTYLKFQEKLKETATQLTDNYTLNVQKVDMQSMNSALMTLNVVGSDGVDRLRNITDEQITKHLENIDGVASVKVYGGREKAIEIVLDKEKCKSLGLSPSKVSALLSQNNEDKTFCGNIIESSKKYFVHVNSSYEKVSDIENVVVGNGPIYLKDIADISYDLKDETTYSRVDGKEVVTISISNDAQSNLIELSDRIKKNIKVLNETVLKPYEVEIRVQKDSAEDMAKNINRIINLALLGGLLAVIILWLFLRNIRLVFFIALSIPISVFTAFNIFYAAGITINTLTLMGIALAIGMLLDNSVVVLENIYRLYTTGVGAKDSVVNGTKEVYRSVLASTLTTVTVFLPFVFSDNYMIKLLGQNIGVSIICTLIISLGCALLFIPMASYLILRSKKGKASFEKKISVFDPIIQKYLVIVKWCMRHTPAVIITAILMFGVSLLLCITLSFNTKQSIDSDSFVISLDMPTSSTLDNTDQVVKVIEERLEKNPDKKEISSQVEDKQARIIFKFDKSILKGINKKSVSTIKNQLEESLKDIQGGYIEVSDPMSSEGGSTVMMGMIRFLSVLGIGNSDEHITIKGTDYDMMQVVAKDLDNRLELLDYIRRARISRTPRQNEVVLRFSPELMTVYQVTGSDINTSLSTLTPEQSSGSKFKVGDKTYDIVIKNKMSAEDSIKKAEGKGPTLDQLNNLDVTTTSGADFKMKEISNINTERGRAKIYRVNQEKQLEIKYYFTETVKDSKSLLKNYKTEIDDMISNYPIPNGVALEVFHEESPLKDFKFLLIAAFLLIYMILASVFESLTTPIVLMFSIPLAATGAFIGLILTGNSLLNANTLVGLMILLGVVVNNGIILIDYSNILRTRGYSRHRAMISAGISRIRPILITSTTTIVAMLPIALGNGEYAGAIGAPFAITVIGGLMFSVLLTLFFIPTAYMGMEDALKWFREQNKGLKFFEIIIISVIIIGVIFTSASLGWKIVYSLLSIFLVPLIFYFLEISLKKANANIISDGDDINIHITNLVKIYDRPSTFMREWDSGEELRDMIGEGVHYHKWKDFKGLIWKIGILAFMIFMCYFHLTQGFWITIFSVLIYLTINALITKVFVYKKYKVSKGINDRLKNKLKRINKIEQILYWVVPLVIFALLAGKINNVTVTIIIFFLWFFCLYVNKTSHYIYDNNINVKRIKGNYNGEKKLWYNIVLSIPIIGHRKRPFKALKGINMDIKTGMFGLLGPNGAGKSTLMRIIAGISEPSYGSIFINSMDTRIYREELQGLIGYLPQEFGTYEHLTAWEFLDYQALLKNIKDEQVRHKRLEYVLKETNMYDRKDQKIGSFSGGMKQRIGIALILLHLPKILIVDEPTAGLDPKERIRFRNLLVELSKNRIVIFSTHIIEDIASSCNQVAIINKGELKYYGDPIEMVSMADKKVWMFDIPRDEFEQYLDIKRVINHIPNNNVIRVRYLSSEKPYNTAVLVEPNLEDAYLCMQKGI